MKFSDMLNKISDSEPNTKIINEGSESSLIGDFVRKNEKQIKKALKDNVFTDIDFDFELGSRGRISIEFHDEDLMSSQSQNQVKKSIENCINNVLEDGGFDFVKYETTDLDEYKFNFEIELNPSKIDNSKLNSQILKKIDKLSIEKKIELLLKY